MALDCLLLCHDLICKQITVFIFSDILAIGSLGS